MGLTLKLIESTASILFPFLPSVFKVLLYACISVKNSKNIIEYFMEFINDYLSGNNLYSRVA